MGRMGIMAGGSRMTSGRRKDRGSGGRADFADDLGFLVSHMVSRGLRVEKILVTVGYCELP
jgi:hypothetical protein